MQYPNFSPIENKFMKPILLFIGIVFLLSCQQGIKETSSNTGASIPKPLIEGRYNVAFLIMDGVYNTEFTAPYDIFQHTQYRDGIKAMNTFTVAKSLEPVISFEGLRILPDYDYTVDSIPPIDILVVPSAEHHMDTDLQDTTMIRFVQKVDKNALFMTSHCDGAFVLAKAGLLEDVQSTTFPADIAAYKKMFPQLHVADSVLFVHDGKYITSAGGAKSFEAALYLTELLYGKEIARSIARGLVIDWNLAEIPCITPQSSVRPGR